MQMRVSGRADINLFETARVVVEQSSRMPEKAMPLTGGISSQPDYHKILIDLMSHMAILVLEVIPSRTNLETQPAWN